MFLLENLVKWLFWLVVLSIPAILVTVWIKTMAIFMDDVKNIF